MRSNKLQCIRVLNAPAVVGVSLNVPLSAAMTTFDNLYPHCIEANVEDGKGKEKKTY